MIEMQIASSWNIFFQELVTLKGLPLEKWTPFFIADLPKTLLFHSRICMSFAWKVSHFGEISQKHGARWAHLSIRGRGAEGAYEAVRSLGPVFLANFSEMADLSDKRHAYSWIK